MVINCRFNRDSGNRVLGEGLADAVAFAKTLHYRTLDLVERIRRGQAGPSGMNRLSIRRDRRVIRTIRVLTEKIMRK